MKANQALVMALLAPLVACMLEGLKLSLVGDQLAATSMDQHCGKKCVTLTFETNTNYQAFLQAVMGQKQRRLGFSTDI